MKKLKLNPKKTLLVILSIVLITIEILVTTYAAVYFGKLPISLPFLSYNVADATIGKPALSVMEQWDGYETYQPAPKYDTIEQILHDANIELDAINREEMTARFPLLDEKTFYTWVANNPESIKDGYERLLIDNVDYMNSPTGIKTIYGDDILALDVMDGIMIVGLNVQSETGTSKVKLAIVNNKKQLDMSLVKDLSYWDVIEKHAKENGAILAVNASGYNWNEAGAYATLYGATKWHGEMVRKSTSSTDSVCFSDDMTLTLGTSIESAYNAIEVSPTLIKDGKAVFDTANGDKSRFARTAIGQNYDGTTFILVASGGVYGSGLGVNNAEVLQIMQRYKVDNATMLSGGSRAIMYWNGRVVNETVGYQQTGVRLPNTIFVKPQVLSE